MRFWGHDSAHNMTYEAKAMATGKMQYLTPCGCMLRIIREDYMYEVGIGGLLEISFSFSLV